MAISAVNLNKGKLRPIKFTTHRKKYYVTFHAAVTSAKRFTMHASTNTYVDP